MRPFSSPMFPATAAVALAVLSSVSPVFATDQCTSLTPEQAARFQTLASKIHAYNGCDKTLAVCLKASSPHFSVRREAQDVCRLIKDKKTDSEIKQAMETRALSLLPPIKKVPYRDDPRTSAGDADAPVIAVVYACARCPFCRFLVPRLYRAVTEGSLKGKVRLVMRPFPLKSHEGALEGGLAMESAAALGKFWPLLNLIYSRYDAFNPALLPAWAEEAGMAKSAFVSTYNDPNTRKALTAAKQEGVVNKVVATPTVFINGVEYVYDMTDGVIEDVLEEAYEGALEKKKAK